MIKGVRSFDMRPGLPVAWVPDLTSYGVEINDVNASGPSYVVSGGFQELLAPQTEARVITDFQLTANSWGGAGHAVFQFAFGGVGAEAVIGEVFHHPYKPLMTPVPLVVPPGVRLSVRVVVLNNISSFGGHLRVGHVSARRYRRGSRGLATGWTTFRNVDYYTSLGTNAPAGTPGAWTELLPAATWNANRAIIGFSYTADSVVDIGIGATIDAVTTLSRMPIGSFAYLLRQPIYVPAGSRIWHRSVIGNAALTCYAVYAMPAPVSQMWL